MVINNIVDMIRAISYMGGASKHNSVPVPSPGKGGGKPENPA